MMKIYKLTTPHSDMVYIGKTTTKLEHRLAKHKCTHKRYNDGKKEKYVSSFKLFDLGRDDVCIELIEETDDPAREGILQKNTPNCVYIRQAGRTTQQYHQEHKEQIKEYHKQWRKANPDKVKILSDAYVKKNKYDVTCECGFVCTKRSLTRHKKSKYHNNIMNGVVKPTIEEKKAALNKKCREKVVCDICNETFNKSSLKRHKQRKHSA